MNSSVYQIRGCYGSQQYIEVESNLSFKDARREARLRNQSNADGLGITLREYLNTINPEGRFSSGRSGQDGTKV